MLAIVFGVLLALVLDDWRQGRDERALAQTVLTSLRAELERNQRVLETRLPYHEAMLDTFDLRAAEARDASFSAAALRGLEELGFAEGLGTTTSLSSGAWQTASASGATSRIGLDELFLLSAAYTSQAQAERAWERLDDKHDRYVLAQVEGERPAYAIIGFAAGLRDVVTRERDLCETYHTLATRLGGELPADAGRCGSGGVSIR